MARPIEPTPPLEGEDAERLLADLERGCSEEERKRRQEWAITKLAQLFQPKGFPKKPPVVSS